MVKSLLPAAALLAAGLLLGACERKAAAPDWAAIAAEPAPDAPTPASGPPSFAGQWAAAPGACGRANWNLTAAGMSSPGSLTCRFDNLDPTTAGYIVLGVCEIGKAEMPKRMTFTLSGSGPTQALTIGGGPFATPFALYRCAAPQTQAAAKPADVPG